MDYQDDKCPEIQTYEEMAKAYSNSLKDKGFVFIRLDNEDYSFLLNEVFDVLFKLRSSYRFLNGFLGSSDFLSLTEKQIEELRKLFDFKKNHSFQLRTNKTKCLLNTISLEANLLLKLNTLAQKSDYFKELSSIASERLLLLHQNYKIEGIFNNLANLNFHTPPNSL